MITDKQKAKLHRLVDTSTYTRVNFFFNTYITTFEDLQTIAKLKAKHV